MRDPVYPSAEGSSSHKSVSEEADGTPLWSPSPVNKPFLKASRPEGGRPGRITHSPATPTTRRPGRRAPSYANGANPGNRQALRRAPNGAPAIATNGLNRTIATKGTVRETHTLGTVETTAGFPQGVAARRGPARSNISQPRNPHNRRPGRSVYANGANPATVKHSVGAPNGAPAIATNGLNRTIATKGTVRRTRWATVETTAGFFSRPGPRALLLRGRAGAEFSQLRGAPFSYQADALGPPSPRANEPSAPPHTEAEQRGHHQRRHGAPYGAPLPHRKPPKQDVSRGLRQTPPMGTINSPPG